MGQAKRNKDRKNAEVLAAISEPGADTGISNLTSVQQAVMDALTGIRQRPFADRNTSLGKMINCDVCGTRHRQGIRCEQKIVVLAYPSRHPKKVRFNPHLKHGKVGRAQAIIERNQIANRAARIKKKLDKEAEKS